MPRSSVETEGADVVCTVVGLTVVTGLGVAVVGLTVARTVVFSICFAVVLIGFVGARVDATVDAMPVIMFITVICFCVEVSASVC